MAYIGISPFGQTVRTVTTITATASQTTFTPTGGYTVGYCDVYYNGIKLVGGTDFTATDGLTIVLTTGATSGAVVEIITYGSVTITDAVRRSGDTFAGAVAINSTLAAGNTTITGNTTTTTLNAGNTAITGTATISGNVVLGTTTITANGGVGTSGQVLTSGATGNAYWSTPAGFSNGQSISVANVAVTNAATFSNTVAVTGTATISNNTLIGTTSQSPNANAQVTIKTNDYTKPAIQIMGSDSNWWGRMSHSVQGGTQGTFISSGGAWSVNGTTFSAVKDYDGSFPTTAAFISSQWNSSTASSFSVLTKAGGSTTTDGTVSTLLGIDTSGRITKPYQPAFHASKAGSPSTTSENPVQYDNVEFNIGSHYNSSTYRFTAPVAGRYFMTAQFNFYLNGNARQIEIALKLNGGVWQTADTFMTQTQGNNTHCNGTVAAVMNLAAGDYVQGAWVSSSATVNFYSPGLRNSFSGFLIG